MAGTLTGINAGRPERPILVVNDNEIDRYATRRTLERAGFVIQEAASGEQALELLQGAASDDANTNANTNADTLLPWLVVLDVSLPGIDGIEVCHRIKSDPAFTSVLVLHLSGLRIRSWDQVTGLEAGADGYLTFPVDPDVLVAHVRSLLRVSRAEQASREAEARLRSSNEALEQRIRERTGELREALSERQELAWRTVTAQEEERRRISRELHDEMWSCVRLPWMIWDWFRRWRRISRSGPSGSGCGQTLRLPAYQSSACHQWWKRRSIESSRKR